MKIASFDVDPQQSFTPLCPNELPVQGGDQIAAALNEMAKRADIRVGSKDAHTPQAVWVVSEAEQMLQPLNYPNADLTWVAHCVPGTKGFELLANLPRPDQYDFFVWKGVEPDMHPYGACYHDLKEKLSTGVIEYLRLKNVQLVIVGGLALDYCVKNTAMQLHKAGFQVIIVLEATRAIAEHTKQQAIAEMQQSGIVICEDCAALDQQLIKSRG
ncbi:nicotinamidase [Entomomonas asaccharolytica]|uniref:nicotinamidase n=1 Tax=Entomomonas asaccharolytica TaxID=2785331 RepID=A0A974NDJ0_9GAMM|nr:nicotinamidase [Entomomonas asaccharolytica]QQP84584.1 nicotinamidase [Entomomonas asaccharolytica]